MLDGQVRWLDERKSALACTHISCADLEAGESLAPAREDLRITSSWAIFGRPRSSEARGQDLKVLQAATDARVSSRGRKALASASRLTPSGTAPSTA